MGYFQAGSSFASRYIITDKLAAFNFLNVGVMQLLLEAVIEYNEMVEKEEQERQEPVW